MPRAVPTGVFVGVVCTLLVLGCGKHPPMAKDRAPSSEGLVGYWKLSEGVGSIARDSSGYGRDGEIRNGEWVKGPQGVALRFNGEDSCVLIPEIPELNGSNELTVEAWVFWEGMGQYPNVLTGGVWNPGGFMIFVSNDHCMFRLGRPGLSAWPIGQGWEEVGLTLLNHLNLGRWYHLAATFRRPEVTGYVDGERVGTASWNYPIGHCGKVCVGRWGQELGPTMSHHGLISEVKLYRRALGGEEIAAAYREQATVRK